MRFVDLSHPIDNEQDWAPERMACRVERSDHDQGAAAIEQMFGLGREYLKSGFGWAVDTIHLSTHGDGRRPYTAPTPTGLARDRSGDSPLPPTDRGV